jgi:hypothetical protein
MIAVALTSAAWLAGCGSGGGHAAVRKAAPRPAASTQAQIQKGVLVADATILHNSSTPELLDSGLAVFGEHALSGLGAPGREAGYAILIAYAKQMVGLKVFPPGGPALLTTWFPLGSTNPSADFSSMESGAGLSGMRVPSTPGLKAFLSGPGASIQAAFLKSKTFAIVAGCQAAALKLAPLVMKTGLRVPSCSMPPGIRLGQ